MPLAPGRFAPGGKLGAPFAAGPATSGTFGSFVSPRTLVSASSAPPREPGDYGARFALKELAATRETLYAAPANTTAYVLEIALYNGSAAVRTVSLFVGGRQVAAVPLAAGQDKRDHFKHVLYAGDRLEGIADGAGVTVYASGVEEVR